MMLRILACLCLFEAVWTQVAEHHGHVFEQLFQAIDQNGDGHIRKAEFDAIASDLDIDGNGKVTEQEFIQAWESVTQGAGDADINRHAAELLFESVDGGSGSISLSNIDVLYTAFDTDGNGDVAKQEFLQEWYKIHPGHGLIGPPQHA